jgi:hypothetical protein
VPHKIAFVGNTILSGDFPERFPRIKSRLSRKYFIRAERNFFSANEILSVTNEHLFFKNEISFMQNKTSFVTETFCLSQMKFCRRKTRSLEGGRSVFYGDEILFAIDESSFFKNKILSVTNESSLVPDEIFYAKQLFRAAPPGPG